MIVFVYICQCFHAFFPKEVSFDEVIHFNCNSMALKVMGVYKYYGG